MIDIEKISSFPSDSKVWVYYPSNTIDSSRINLIKEKLATFSESWNSHGSQVRNYIDLIQPHNIILIVADSSTFPSGCSIDSQVAMIREVEGLSGLAYMDRSSITFLRENQFQRVNIQDTQDIITPDTMVFNPFFDDLKDWSENFLVIARNSKYKKMLGF